MFGKEKWDKAYKKSAMETKVGHSRAYHKFFEGFSEYYVIDENGKRKIRREYTNTGFSPDISSKRFLAYKLIYWVLFIVGGGLFVFSSLKGNNGVLGIDQYAAFLEAATLFVMVLLLWGLICYSMCSGFLSIHDFKSGPQKVRTFSLLTWIGMSATLLMIIIYSLVNIRGLSEANIESSYTHELILSFVGMILASVSVFIIYFMESHIRYLTTGEKYEIEDGIEIE